jgi:hypothetical protein
MRSISDSPTTPYPWGVILSGNWMWFMEQHELESSYDSQAGTTLVYVHADDADAAQQIVIQAGINPKNIKEVW